MQRERCSRKVLSTTRESCERGASAGENVNTKATDVGNVDHTLLKV